MFPKPSSGRAGILLIFSFLFGGIVFLRLYMLQVLGEEGYKRLADNQHQVSSDIAPDRGEVYFREGDATYPAAVNREYPMLYLSPREITDVAAVASAVSSAVSVPVEEIRSKCADRNDPFEIIKKKLSDDEVGRIKSLTLPGIHLLPEKYRFYPGSGLAAQVIGFVSTDDQTRAEKGKYGIEASLDEELRGKPGHVIQSRDAAGRWISTEDREVVPAVPGADVVLTIDQVIQNETERILSQAMEKHQATGGSVIVMEPSTGKILAMASSPSFDSNAYASVDDYSRFMNPTVSQSYEPGSVMKPLTMAVGIEEGKVNPDTEYVDTGSVTLSGYTIHNAEDKVYGKSTMTKVLDNSINTGVIFVEKLVGNERFRKYMEDFGFGERSGIELPAELPGSIGNLSDTRQDLEFYTASFGQGVTTTPLQMVTAYAALANGGTLMRPQIIDRYIRDDGTEEETLPSKVRQVVSPDTARQIGDMLESVVLIGHGKQANVPGYRVGGKTGTAQVAKAGGGGYEEGLSIGTFVGYAPLDNPKFVVLAKIDNPKDVVWAESSAAPMFGDVMKFLLSYAKIEPTKPIPEKK